MAERYGCELEALYFDVPVEVCIERNRQRQPKVPEEAIREMARVMIPPAKEEGFTTVIRVNR
jgi:predicted kinase